MASFAAAGVWIKGARDGGHPGMGRGGRRWLQPSRSGLAGWLAGSLARSNPVMNVPDPICLSGRACGQGGGADRQDSQLAGWRAAEQSKEC